MRRRLPFGWPAALVLFGLYVVIKIQGGWYATKAEAGERRMQDLRPALSAIILYGRLQDTHTACAQTFEEIRRLDFQAESLLVLLSQAVPASVTLEKLEFNPRQGVRIHGTFTPGIRPLEGALLSWTEKLKATGASIKVQELSPDPETQGLWHFELKLEGP